ncbi:MAG: hypothetical protein NC311_11370 [Muribaculaceae bacterium]|nr:hypothetical protein [Muribaculaceae bacterium]
MATQEQLKKYIQAGGEEIIYHGEYAGVLVDLQPLTDGTVCGIYRFKGGECIGSKALKI